MTDSTDTPALGRRRMLGGAAAAGLAAPFLAACGSDDEPESSSSGSSASSQPKAKSSGGGLVATADVPVGGGVVVEDAKVVVTQPAKGDFKAFTAVCSHQGCLVTSVADDTISCPCHGSQFSATDGSVKNGPASSPLASVAVRVKGGEVVRSS